MEGMNRPTCALGVCLVIFLACNQRTGANLDSRAPLAFSEAELWSSTTIWGSHSTLAGFDDFSPAFLSTAIAQTRRGSTPRNSCPRSRFVRELEAFGFGPELL